LISREDFIFTIGYKGNTAVVSGMLKRKYSRASIDELVKNGLFKPAICYALYENDEDALERILKMYNEMTDYKLRSVEELKRTFGVTKLPEEVNKVIVL